MSIRIKNKDELRTKVLTVEQMTKGFDWSAYFENENPFVLDAGCGKGEFLLEEAKRNQNLNFIAVDYSWKKCLFAQKKIDFHQVKNALIIRASFEDLFEAYFPSDFFIKIHMNFPDPWPKKKHHRRRSLKTWLVDQYFRMLKTNGDFYFVTDHDGYAEEAFPIIDAHKNFENQLAPHSSVRELEGYFKTLFCQKAEEKGDSSNYLWFKKVI